MVDNGLNQHDESMLTEEIFVCHIPVVCVNEWCTSCKMRRRKIHTFCGHASKGDEMDVLCNICFKSENAIESKMNSKINLEIQAKKKWKWIRKK